MEIFLFENGSARRKRLGTPDLDRRKSKEDAQETKNKYGAIIERNEVKIVQEDKKVMEDDGSVIRTMWQQDNKEETLRAEDPIFVGEDEAVMDDKEIVLEGSRQFEKVSRAEDPIFVRKDEDIMELQYQESNNAGGKKKKKVSNKRIYECGVSKDPRLQLLKKCGLKGWKRPKYTKISSKVYNDHILKHVMAVRVNGRKFSNKEPFRTKGLAKQAAARKCLRYFNKIDKSLQRRRIWIDVPLTKNWYD